MLASPDGSVVVAPMVVRVVPIGESKEASNGRGVRIALIGESEEVRNGRGVRITPIGGSEEASNGRGVTMLRGRDEG
jgi:hypothetical protein